MKKEDVLINSILSLFVAFVATIITNKFNLDISIIILITLIIVSIFWLSSFINEINQKTKNNLGKIKKNKEEIISLKKDLNTERRLSRLEYEINNIMNKKRGQVSIPDLIKIGFIIVLLLLLLKAFGVF